MHDTGERSRARSGEQRDYPGGLGDGLAREQFTVWLSAAVRVGAKSKPKHHTSMYCLGRTQNRVFLIFPSKQGTGYTYLNRITNQN